MTRLTARRLGPSVWSVLGYLAALVISATLSPAGPGSSRAPTPKAASPPAGATTRSRAALTAPPGLTRLLRDRAAQAAGSSPPGRGPVTSEGFEGTFPPTLWEVEDGDSTAPEAYWGKDDWQHHGGTYSAYCVRSGAQGVDPASSNYPNYANSWMVYGPFSLANAGQATLDFSAWLDTEPGYDYLYWTASSDGVNFDGWQLSGTTSGWAAEDLDLADVGTSHANLLGQPEVWVAFVFTSDYSITAKGVFVDDVLVQTATGPGVPSPLNPINHTTLSASRPPFQWSTVGGATSYEVVVDDSPSFTVPYVYSNSNVTATTVTPPSGLPDGTYYWRVRAKQGAAVSDWSATWGFTVRTVGAPEWTVMVYLDADNNLESYGLDDMLEMMSGAGNPNVNICVLFDRAAGYVTSYDNWTTTRRYKLTPATTLYNSSPDYVDVGELNMGASQTLVDFVTWAETTYPAQYYALVYWDHGAGWEPRMRGPLPTKIICIDDGSGDDYLTLSEIDAAMGAFPEKVDVCGMDACLMAQIEVAYHLKDRFDYFVASEDSEPGPGWVYDGFLPAAKLPPGTTPAQMAATIVQSYQTYYDPYNIGSQSAWTASGLATCANKISALASQLIAGLSTYRTQIGNAWTNAYRFEAYSGQNAYIDVYAFCDYLTQYVTGADTKDADGRVARGITSAAADLRTYLVSPSFQVAEWHDPQAYGATTPMEGLSIYFPQTSAEYFYGNYNGANLAFVADPQQLWDEFLKAYLTTATPPPPPQSLAAADHPGDAGGAVDLTWDRSADDGTGQDDVTQYRIFRDHVLVHTVPATNSASYAYTDTGLDNGVQYCYLVRAFDGSMESADSNTACATPVNNQSSDVIAVDLDPATPGVQTTRAVPAGASFDVDVVALQVQDLASYNAAVQWTAGKLTADRVAQGPFLRSAGGSTVFPTPALHADWAEVSEAVLSPTAGNSPDGGGVLFTVSFTANGLGAVDVGFSGSLGAGTVFGNASGQYTVPAFQGATVTVGLPGDLDGDGDVDVADLQQFRLYWGGTRAVSASERATCGSYEAAADLNDDGQIDREDFWLMWYDNAPYHTGWVPGDVTGTAASSGCPTGYPAAAPDDYLDFWDLVAFTGKWQTQQGDPEWDEAFDFAGPSGSAPAGPDKPCPVDGVVNFHDLVAFAAAWHTGQGPAAPLGDGKAAPPPAEPVLALESSSQGTLLAGDEVDVTVRAVGASDLRSYDFKVTYDPQAFELPGGSFEDGSFLESGGGTALFMQDVRKAGRVWLTGSLVGRDLSKAPSGTGVLAHIRLRAKGSAQGAAVGLQDGIVLDSHGAVTAAASQQLNLNVGALAKGDWRCRIEAHSGGEADCDNYFGVIANADLRQAAGRAPDEAGGLRLSFVTNDGAGSRSYLAPGTGKLTYRFVVDSAPPNADVTVNLPDLSGLPPGIAVRLVDEGAGRTVSVRTQNVYRYNTANGPARSFRIEVAPERRGALLVTGLDAVPTRGGGVSIGFTLSRDAAVDFGVYNVAGRRVRRLDDGGEVRPAGRQAMVWDGRSDAGTIVPAGTYLIRVDARAPDGGKAGAVTSLTVIR